MRVQKSLGQHMGCCFLCCVYVARAGMRGLGFGRHKDSAGDCMDGNDGTYVPYQ